MSILDDENILIEKTKDTTDFSVMLDSVIGDYKITGSIFTKSGEDLFKTLPCFGEYEWVRYGDRFTMYHTTTRRVIVDIMFYKILQYYSLKYEYKYMVQLVIYSNYCTFDIYDYFKSLFKLDDELMWECKHLKDNTLRYTIYKKLKYN